MSDKTLAELSEEGRLNFAGGKHHDAAKVLTEARNSFPQAPSERIDQGPDGSLVITTIQDDGKGGQKIAKQRPVTGESKEYRADDYRDTSEDEKPVEEKPVEETRKDAEAVNTYGKIGDEDTDTEKTAQLKPVDPTLSPVVREDGSIPEPVK